VWAPGQDGAGADTGHVGYVEVVNPDGSMIVSEMGAGNTGDYATYPASMVSDLQFVEPKN